MKLATTVKTAFQTKTGWTGLAAVGFGISQILNGDQNTGIQSIMMGLGAIFMREGVSKNGVGE